MSDEVLKRRLYVGGLAENVTEEELKDRFARFVNVSNLTLKSRTDSEGNHIKSFAHFDVQGTEESIKRCFSAYQNAKWKGSVMKLQDAKESFMDRLAVEREEERNKEKTIENSDKKPPPAEWVPPEFTKFTGAAVPGTPVPGKKGWVVGKYGRVVPVLNVKKSFKTKAVKHDPSKFCHAAKVFKDDTKNAESSTHCDTLTWEIDTPDSEITKKRKGEFPQTAPTKKPRPFPTDLLSSSEPFLGSQLHKANAPTKHKQNDDDGLEIVKVGQTASDKSKQMARSKFDSDYESDMEEDNSCVKGNMISGQTRCALKKENNHIKNKTSPNKTKIDKTKLDSTVTEGTKVKKSKTDNTKVSKSITDKTKADNTDTDSPKVKKTKAEKLTKTPLSSKKNGENKSSIPMQSLGSEKEKDVKAVDKSDSSPSVKTGNKDKKISKESSSNTKKRKRLMTDDDEKDEEEDEEEEQDDDVTQEHRRIPEFRGIKSLISKATDEISLDRSLVAAKQVDVRKESKINKSDKKDSMTTHASQNGEYEAASSSGDDQESEDNYDDDESGDEVVETSSDDEDDKDGSEDEESHGDEDSSDDEGSVESDASEEEEEEEDDEMDGDDAESESDKPEEEDVVKPAEQLKPNKAILSSNERISKSGAIQQQAEDLNSASSKNEKSLQKKAAIENTKTFKSPSLDKKLKNVSIEGSKPSNATIPSTKTGSCHTNADLSEFVAEAPDLASNQKDSSDNSDSYDSDLDSNDFELVAKKLALKAAADKQMKSGKMQSTSKASTWENGNSKKRKINHIDAYGEENNNQIGNALKNSSVELSRDSTKTSTLKASGVQSKLLTLAEGCEEEKKADKIDGGALTGQAGSGSKQEVDNAKRLQAIKEQGQVRQRQQALMKTALRNVDSASTKRIVFSSSDEDDDDDASNANANNNKQKGKKTLQTQDERDSITTDEKQKVSAMNLLGSSSDEDSDDSEDVEEMFKSKPQFEGKKGEKLMKMQKKFGDSRFKLDAKFVDSDDDESDDGSNNDDDDQEDGIKAESVSADKSDEPASLAAERKRNLEVLASVVGKHKVDRLTAKLQRDNIKMVDMNQMRFDPTKVKPKPEPVKEEKDKVTTKQEGSKKSLGEKTSKKNKTSDQDRSGEEDPIPVTEVKRSKVTLSDSLVDMLRPKSKDKDSDGGNQRKETPFSLSDMFGGGMNNEEEEEEITKPEWKKPLQQPLSGLLSPKPSSKAASKETDKQAKKLGDSPTKAGPNRTKIEETQMEIDEDAEEKDKLEVVAEDRKTAVKPPVKLFMNLQGEEEEDDEMKNDDKKEDLSKLRSTDTSKDPVQEREKILRDAGRIDFRFSKEQWLDRFSDIRHDLLQMCKKRYREAKKRKRAEDEQKRKKAVLKKAGKSGKAHQWWRKK